MDVAARKCLSASSPDSDKTESGLKNKCQTPVFTATRLLDCEDVDHQEANEVSPLWLETWSNPQRSARALHVTTALRACRNCHLSD
eukprot:5235375-Amphidinium_carterae.1